MNIHKSNEIVEQCLTARLIVTKSETERVECARVNMDSDCLVTCTTYRWPAAMWHNRRCAFAQEELTEEQHKMLNPLKASKRAAKKKKE